MDARYLDKLVSPVIAGLVLSAIGLASLPAGAAPALTDARPDRPIFKSRPTTCPGSESSTPKSSRTNSDGKLIRTSPVPASIAAAISCAPSKCRQPKHHYRLVGFAPIFCRGATVGRPGVAAGPCRRRRRPNRTSGFAEGARALPTDS
jgi:hypothetical protein